MPNPSIFLIFTGPPIGDQKRFQTRRIMLTNWLTQKICGSSTTHVSISDGTYVFSSGVPGREYYHATDFAKIPNLRTIVELEWLQPFTIDGYARDKPAPIWKSIAKALTRGLIQTDDCLCIVKKVLATAGYDVPRRVWSPGLLLEWCATDANSNIRQGRNWITRHAG